MAAHTRLYEAVRHVLAGAGSITAKVPADNIRPSEDPLEPAAGNSIVYNWQAGRWFPKSRRGEGVLSLQVGAVNNKLVADEILDLVRAVLSARALSYSGSPVRVHQFVEDGAFTDAGTTDSDRFQAATSFQVRMIEAPNG